METLENVKVGDKLLTSHNYGESIEIVERITETLVITKHYRYGKKDGYAKGMNRYSYRRAKPATEEDVERIRENNKRNILAAKCNGIRFETLSVAQLEGILEIAGKKE